MKGSIVQSILRPIPRLAALLLVPVLVTTLACGPGESGDAEATSPGDGDYTVRGEITQLPEGDGPLTVRHEAIPDFVSIDGEVVGMDAMTMPFPLADGVSLDGIDAGDPVEFDLEVRWEGSPPYRITRIEELPEN